MYTDRARSVETRKTTSARKQRRKSHEWDGKVIFKQLFFYDIRKNANVSNDCEMFKCVKLNLLVTFSLPALYILSLQRVHVRL